MSVGIHIHRLENRSTCTFTFPDRSSFRLYFPDLSSDCQHYLKLPKFQRRSKLSLKQRWLIFLKYKLVYGIQLGYLVIGWLTGIRVQNEREKMNVKIPHHIVDYCEVFHLNRFHAIIFFITKSLYETTLFCDLRTLWLTEHTFYFICKNQTPKVAQGGNRAVFAPK